MCASILPLGRSGLSLSGRRRWRGRIVIGTGIARDGCLRRGQPAPMIALEGRSTHGGPRRRGRWWRSGRTQEEWRSEPRLRAESGRGTTEMSALGVRVQLAEGLARGGGSPLLDMVVRTAGVGGALGGCDDVLVILFVLHRVQLWQLHSLHVTLPERISQLRGHDVPGVGGNHSEDHDAVGTEMWRGMVWDGK